MIVYLSGSVDIFFVLEYRNLEINTSFELFLRMYDLCEIDSGNAGSPGHCENRTFKIGHWWALILN